MTHPVAEKTEATVAALRASTREGYAPDDHTLADGAYLSWDTESADISVDLSADPGQIFSLNARVKGEPRWFSFNIGLGSATVEPGQALGIVLDHEGRAPNPLQIFIRTARGDEFEDTVLTDSAEVSAKRRITNILHWIMPEDAIAEEDAFHTLVIAMPPQDFSWILHDMRLFVVSAGEHDA